MSDDITLTVSKESNEPADARAFQRALDAVLRLLRSQASDDVQWEIADLKIGSAVCGIAPDRDTDASRKVVDGLAQVAQGKGVPPGWSRKEVSMISDLARARTSGAGTVISIDLSGEQVVSVDASLDAELKRLLAVRHKSITSLTGVLDSWSLRGRTEAIGLTTPIGARLTVYYEAEMTDMVRESVGKRVDLRCKVGRNFFGDIVSANLLDCQILADRSTLPRPDVRSLLGLLNDESFEPNSLQAWLNDRGKEEAFDG